MFLFDEHKSEDSRFFSDYEWNPLLNSLLNVGADLADWFQNERTIEVFHSPAGSWQRSIVRRRRPRWRFHRGGRQGKRHLRPPAGDGAAVHAVPIARRWTFGLIRGCFGGESSGPRWTWRCGFEALRHASAFRLVVTSTSRPSAFRFNGLRLRFLCQTIPNGSFDRNQK